MKNASGKAVKGSKSKAPATKSSGAGKGTSPNRKLAVFVSLVGTLGLTSALLLALAPAPLTPDGTTSLFAIESPKSLNSAIFNTKTPTQTGHWKYIYVHQSATTSGSAETLADNGDVGDHFVIGNGDGATDGQIQMSQRWNTQQSAEAPAGVSRMDPGCVSICLVGDFDHGRPTTTQLNRLNQLVATLQSELHIPASRVLTVQQAGSPAGVGQYFPTATFRDQLLP